MSDQPTDQPTEFERAAAAVERTIPTHWDNGQPIHPLDQIDPVFNATAFFEAIAAGVEPEEAYVNEARAQGYEF